MRTLFKIKINSKEHRGRYVGPMLVSGLSNDPELLKTPAIPVSKVGVSLYVQKDFAIPFLAPQEIQAELKLLGYDTELVEVA